MLCYLREYAVENTAGVEKASEAPSHWQTRGAVATVDVLLRQCVGVSGCGGTESQALACLSSDHGGECVCV